MSDGVKRSEKQSRLISALEDRHETVLLESVQGKTPTECIEHFWDNLVSAMGFGADQLAVTYLSCMMLAAEDEAAGHSHDGPAKARVDVAERFLKEVLVTRNVRLPQTTAAAAKEILLSWCNTATEEEASLRLMSLLVYKEAIGAACLENMLANVVKEQCPMARLLLGVQLVLVSCRRQRCFGVDPLATALMSAAVRRMSASELNVLSAFAGLMHEKSALAGNLAVLGASRVASNDELMTRELREVVTAMLHADPTGMDISTDQRSVIIYLNDKPQATAAELTMLRRMVATIMRTWISSHGLPLGHDYGVLLYDAVTGKEFPPSA